MQAPGAVGFGYILHCKRLGLFLLAVDQYGEDCKRMGQWPGVESVRAMACGCWLFPVDQCLMVYGVMGIGYMGLYA